ncbi:enoyl-CoA hydratase-related protein [Plastorhodobacter daqingensis]|uniref:Enoyl-CoA hydratase-related protein n=1 Tax=Plastorhodobacter daqingensis TaxID=1387281 RepID=A0ABW2UJ67_9RHOB
MSDQVWIGRDGALVVLRFIERAGQARRIGPLLDAARCNALTEALATLAPDDAAVLLVSGGPGFGWGPEPDRLPDASEAEALARLCDRIDRMPVPVVALLQGAALGAGFELALAAHYRVALADARLGFPDIMLGLPPGAGATQRLPRIIGAEAAVRVLLSAPAVDLPAAQDLGLLDAVVPDEAAARAFALSLVGQPRPAPTRLDRLDLRAGHAAVNAARAVLRAPALPALRAVVDSVEAALLLPWEAGLAYERVQYEDCLRSEAARGLRHAALCDQRVARLQDAAAQGADLPETLLLSAMPANLAQAALAAGMRVVLYHPEKDGALAALHGLAELLDAAEAEGRLTGSEIEDSWSRLVATTESARAGQAELALLGDADIARRLRPHLPASLPLCVTEPVAGAVTMTPVPGACQPRLWEIRSEGAPPRATAAAYGLMRALGWPALPGSAVGSPVLLVLAEVLRVLVTMRDDGLEPATIDARLGVEGWSPSPLRHLEQSAVARAVAAAEPWPDAASGMPVWEAVLAAAAQGAARLLQADPAVQPWMIDHALVHAAGFPRWRGGPLAAADHHGLKRIIARIQAMGQRPVPLLADLARSGSGFDALDRAPALRPVAAPPAARISPG